MTQPLSLFGGTGFILSRYAQLYPEAFVEPRDRLFSTHPNALYGISTTDNYAPKRGDLTIDVDTNVLHLLKVLPNVPGVFSFLSSWFVAANAGQDPDAPAREDCACDPRGFYSASKLLAEHLIRSYQQTISERPYRILRLCNVLGNDPRANKQKNALEHLLRLVVHGETVPIYEGTNFRNFLHVNDVCRAIHLCLSRDDTLNGIINIGAPQSVQLIDLIEHAKERVGSTSPIVRVPVPPFHRIVQVPDFFFNTDRLQSLGFTPKGDAFGAVDRVLEGILRKDALDTLAEYIQPWESNSSP